MISSSLLAVAVVIGLSARQIDAFIVSNRAHPTLLSANRSDELDTEPPMKQRSSLKQLLKNGGKAYGPVVMSDSPVIVEMLSLVGYDHLVIDFEHSPSGLHNSNALLRAMDAACHLSSKRTEPIVRLAGHDTIVMKKLLDSMQLPGGVLVPMVDDAATAQKVVSSTSYPAQLNDSSSIGGIRGCATSFVRASGWGTLSANDYMQKTQDELLVMVQVESPEGVRNIHEIASIEGIDGIFLGPFDLSTSIGKMGDFEDQEVKQFIEEAERRVLQTDCFLAGFRPPNRSLQEMYKRGYSLVCGSPDIALLRSAAMLDMEAANKAKGE